MPEERNLLAHAPKHPHDEIKADFNDMMRAEAAAEVVAKREAFPAEWKLRCRPVAESLAEAGERPLTFPRYPPEQRRSLGTTNAIGRPHEDFKRRIKTRCLLPCAETAAMPSPGRSSRRVRSPRAGSMAGRPSTAHPATSTSPPDQPNHAPSVPAPPSFHHLRDTTRTRRRT